MHAKGFITIMLILAAILTAGCSKKQTYTAPGGQVTVTEKGGDAQTVEVKTEEGKAAITVEKKSITEEELGVPVYPGAKVEVSGSYQGSDEGQEENMQHNTLTTKDDFEKVLEFYQSKLKNVKNTISQTMGDTKLAIFELESDKSSDMSLHIMMDKDQKLTRIQVVKVQKEKD